ncbi:MAG: hypothetical protein AAF264_01160, partial [Pseudomonadota bacterium]
MADDEALRCAAGSIVLKPAMEVMVDRPPARFLRRDRLLAGMRSRKPVQREPAQRALQDRSNPWVPGASDGVGGTASTGHRNGQSE